MPYITSFERSGIEKGLKQGRQEGRRQGLQQGLQEAISAALTTDFGAAGKRLMARIRGIRDVDELRALLNVILSAESLKEIRDRLPPREG